MIELEFSLFASMFFAELQFDAFSSIVKLISLPLYIEKIKMLVVPCRMFTIVTLSVSRLLELEHVQSSFGPLTARNRKFSAEAVCELLDVKNVNPLRLSR